LLLYPIPIEVIRLAKFSTFTVVGTPWTSTNFTDDTNNVEAKPLGPTSLRKRVEIADTGGDVLLFLQKPDVDPKLRIV
jgi:hypothetical protein